MNDRQEIRDDEALSAYLDGALSSDDERALRERLDADPALQQRLDALRSADAAVRRAYAPIADEPLPDGVLQRLRRADDRDGAGGRDRKRDDPGGTGNGTGTGAGADIVRFHARSRPSFTIPAAIAAGIALAGGILLSFAVLNPLGPRASADLLSAGGMVERGTALFDVLESRASTETADLPAGSTATPRLTFVNAAGQYCRQVDIASAGGATHALACRRDGEWRLELVSFAPPAAPAREGVYRPASGSQGAAPAALDAAITAMIDGEPLGQAAEREAIARQWAAAPPAAR